MQQRWRQQADRSVVAAARRTVGATRRWVRRNKLATALIVAGVLGASLLFSLEAAAERGGHSLDPTDPMNYNSYALRNDSAITLYVHLCSDPACAALDRHVDWVTVPAHATMTEDVYWGPQESASYAVTDATAAGGRRCLVLDAAAKAPATVDAPLSSAGHCG